MRNVTPQEGGKCGVRWPTAWVWGCRGSIRVGLFIVEVSRDETVTTFVLSHPILAGIDVGYECVVGRWWVGTEDFQCCGGGCKVD